MGKPSEMLMQMSADVVRLFGHGARSDCRKLVHGGVALSGEAAADLNMVLLTGAATKAELDEALAAVSAKGVDALLVVEEGAEAVRAWAVQAGLAEVGQVPLMERQAAATAPVSGFTLRLARPDEADVGARLAAAAFALDEAACRAALPASFLQADGNDLWLAEENGEAVGSGVFIRSGDHVGVYTMSTPPAHQRRGVGRAVLDAAMAHYRDAGVTRFTLGATEKGYPLYERVGFQVVTSPHVFVVGASTQFPGH
jgi:GNAT superfamily N-acetyltransferase